MEPRSPSQPPRHHHEATATGAAVAAPAAALPELRVVLGGPDGDGPDWLPGDRASGVMVVGRAHGTEDLLEAVERHAPHVVVLGAALGVDVLDRLGERAPASRRLLVADDVEARADELAGLLGAGRVHGVLDAGRAGDDLAAAVVGTGRCELVAPGPVIAALAADRGVTGAPDDADPIIDPLTAVARLAGGEPAEAVARDLGATAHLVRRAAAVGLGLD